MIISIIVAYYTDPQGRYVIGNEGKVPWHSPRDLRRFKEFTTGHPVIMGRATHESIGRLLPNRTNIILTRQGDYKVFGAEMFSDLDKALAFANNLSSEIFIIGGADLYKQTIHRAERLYITRIMKSAVKGDRFFPYFRNEDFREIYKEYSEDEQFSLYQRDVWFHKPKVIPNVRYDAEFDVRYSSVDRNEETFWDWSDFQE